MERSEPSYLVVGHLNKAHGTKGELFVWPLTDHPESTFAPGVILLVGDGNGDAPDPGVPSVSIEAVRPFRKGFLLKLRGVHDRDGAEALKGRYLLRAVEELEPVTEGEVFYHQLVGMRVVTVQGEELGVIREVYELRPADLLEVSGPGGTRLIPFLASVVVEVSAEEGVMTIDPPAGLLEI